MKVEKTKNKSAKTRITEAFIELLSEKPYDRIQIIEICDKAGVSRQSYYCIFKEKSKIITNYISDCFAEFLCDFKATSMSLSDVVGVAINYFNKEEKLTNIIFKNYLDFLLVKPIEENLHLVYSQYNFSEDDINTVLAFISFGFIGVIKREFQNNGKVIDPERTKDTVCALMSGKYFKEN